jgi:DNA-binding transcriptional ArsR family regulator
MEDIRAILSQFHSKKRKENDIQTSGLGPFTTPVASEIPDLFFDVVLQKFKLNRNEIVVLMHLYRQVWCRANLYKSHGIGPINSLSELSQILQLSIEELHHHIRSLENYGFIETVRSGQYFVRKYFTEDLDRASGQNYNDFF